MSGIGGLVEQNTPFFTVKILITRLLELDSCKNMHEREQLILQHVVDEELRRLLPLLNDILVLKVIIFPCCLSYCIEQHYNLMRPYFSITVPTLSHHYTYVQHRENKIPSQTALQHCASGNCHTDIGSYIHAKYITQVLQLSFLPPLGGSFKAMCLWD